MIRTGTVGSLPADAAVVAVVAVTVRVTVVVPPPQALTATAARAVRTPTTRRPIRLSRAHPTERPYALDFGRVKHDAYRSQGSRKIACQSFWMTGSSVTYVPAVRA